MAFIQSQDNQLLFNLDIPASANNMAARFQRPEAIIIEKCGPSAVPQQSNTQKLNLSTLSEEKMSVAVQLAKRDLKKQHEQEELEQSRKQNSEKGVGKKGKAKILQSREYREKKKKRQNRDPQEKVYVLKEREKGKYVKTSSSQTKQETTPRKQKSGASRVNLAHLPASSMSPPTRDTDPLKQPQAPLDPQQQQMAEICHQRQEIEEAVRKIRAIKQKADATNTTDNNKKSKRQYAEDIEEERKRVKRCEEHASRFTRSVYQLGLQARDVHTEIEQCAGQSLTAEKKCQLLSRVAAAHRGTVRMLHSLVQHLPDYPLARDGLPRTFHDLTSVIRQLSVCCAQLEVAGQTGVPHSVLQVIQDLDDLNQTVDAELHSPAQSPPRACGAARGAGVRGGQLDRQTKATEARRRSPVGREVYTQDDLDARRATKHTQPAFQQEVARNNRPSKRQPPAHGTDVGVTPDRASALRAGINALLRAGEVQPPESSYVPPLNLPSSARNPPARMDRGNAPHNRPTGVLMPADLAAKRQRAAQTRPQQMTGHYAQATLSSRMKEIPPEDRPQPTSPKSPRRGLSRSPGHYQRRSPPRSRSPSPVDLAKADIDRRVRMDRDLVNQMLAGDDDDDEDDALFWQQQYQRSQHKDRRQLQAEIEPLLDDGQADMDADLVAEQLLDDMLMDTAGRIQEQKHDEQVGRDAAMLMGLPTAESLMQRLHQMEVEQEQIRQKYAAIVYDDEFTGKPASATYYDRAGCDEPATPEPILMTAGDLTTSERRPDNHRLTTGNDKEAILFTKPPASGHTEQLQLSHYPALARSLHQPTAPVVTPPTRLYLAPQSLSRIQQARREYHQYLHKSTGNTANFNPQLIVQSVADDIFNECLTDVAKELDDINTEIVTHVYKAEFVTSPHEALLEGMDAAQHGAQTAASSSHTRQTNKQTINHREITPRSEKNDDVTHEPYKVHDNQLIQTGSVGISSNNHNTDQSDGQHSDREHSDHGRGSYHERSEHGIGNDRERSNHGSDRGTFDDVRFVSDVYSLTAVNNNGELTTPRDDDSSPREAATSDGNADDHSIEKRSEEVSTVREGRLTQRQTSDEAVTSDHSSIKSYQKSDVDTRLTPGGDRETPEPEYSDHFSATSSNRAESPGDQSDSEQSHTASISVSNSESF